MTPSTGHLSRAGPSTWTSIDNTLAAIPEKPREAMQQQALSSAFLLPPPNPTTAERVRPL